MGKKVLFSAVSNADPISRFMDGPMLHLCRHQRPDVVYLYFSSSFLDYHRKDDRYQGALRLLGEQIGHEFEIHLIEKENLKNAHLFDTFYEEFERIYREIFLTHGDDATLIINLSSGTPAMQSCLATLAVNSHHHIALYQVPEDRGGNENENRELPKEFDLLTYWENDLDNEYEKNRCLLIENGAFSKQIQKEFIADDVTGYDYPAALKIAGKIRDSIPEDVYTLLEIACCRIGLEKKEYLKIINEKKKEGKTELYEDLIPIRSDEKILLYEYLLYLDLKVRTEQYAEMVRGITPLLYEFSRYVLEKRCRIHLEAYCTTRKGTVYLDRAKLESDEAGKRYLQCLEEVLPVGKRFETSFLADWQIIAIINGEGRVSDTLKTILTELREVERNIRNAAAHTIVAISNEDIRKKTDLTAEEIIRKFRRAFELAGFEITDETWNSYDAMNRKICALLRA